MQKVLGTVDKYAWWSALNHGGLLIAPTKLGEFFVEELTNLPRYQIDHLRRDLDLFATGEANSLGALLDTVLEGILGLSGSDWQKGNQVEPVWSQKLITGEVLKPRRVWQGYYGSALPVFTADGTRLGIGKGRRAVSRVIEWLRRADQKIAVLTNGKQWRLIHAGSDYDAWCETDSSLWFEEGQLGLQITAWRSLLSTKTLTASKKGELSPLLAAISASRQGQADLSEHLGERVRLAVELLIQETLARQEDLGIDSQSLYLAATRIVMRCVFILFAEARDLLPRDNAIYNQSYSLQGLREQLDRVSGGRASEALRNRWSAYPRLLALFSLVYHGCSHEALPIPQYGGGLFKPGSPDDRDRVLQALPLFEKPQEEQLPCDEVVYKILELLTRSPVKVRQGRKATWVTAPVDFSDLSSEYIGILYEGLLDFELRQADPENPMIFLNFGNQSVLPLSRLEEMDDKTLESLVEKLKKQAKSSTAGEESEESEEEEIIDEGLEEEDLAEEEMADLEPELLIPDDQVADLRDRAHQWAVKAVKVGKLVAKPKGKKPDVLGKYEAEVSQLAKRLIARIILPGEWFLVRWGGTRKGSGTFYTRPQLAIPTVRRTLEPLVYQTSVVQSGSEGLKSPKDILNLKICDPACGSASFPVAALRYLTEALWDSLFTHAWLIEDTQKGLIRVGIPQDAQPAWFVQVVEDLPLTAEKAEEISKAKLRRYVVENCIYGVDINPLAVELGRLALWVETMDKSLPFTFLDHKIKCGNALVGCWFDRFQDYPVMAWEREGGDKNHTKFVHHFREAVNKQGKINKSGDKWTQAIKDLRNEDVKKELKAILETLHSPDSKQLSFEFPNFDLPQLPEAIHDEALAIFNEIHAQVNDPNQQEEDYRQKIKESDAIKQLKFAFDSWCAVWFWEGDLLEFAPTPNKFFNPPEKTRQIIQKLASQYQFFHWELEFPDVFTGQSSGFNGIVGNPPWEIQKPNSMEFFSNIDPLYRTYGKQEALQKQLEFFENDPEIEKGWLAYCDRLKALSNWTKNVGFPFGDPSEKCGNKFSLSRSGAETTFLHELWRNRRLKHKGYADPRHPFIFQGSADINTYKMFLELSLLLLRQGGRMGLIVPSGVYTDKGSTNLRTEFLEFNQWEWLFGFENRDGIFKIHRSFKFCPVIVVKGGQTEAIKATFMQRSLTTWENAEEYVLDYPRSQITKFSPNSKAILEIRSERDLEVLEKMYSNSVLLGDDSPQSWEIKYATEFHMTNDSKLFPPRPKWEAQGYIADEYGHWLKGNWQSVESGEIESILNRPEGLILSANSHQAIFIKEVADIGIPFYEGRMIGQFDFSEKGWISGKGRTAVWRDISFENKVIEPQYVMSLKGLRYDSPKG